MLPKLINDFIERRERRRNPLQPKPKLVGKVVALDTYDNLAAEIGYEPPTRVVHELRVFLANKGLPVYDTNEVWAYMDAVARKEGCGWDWFPLRAEDNRGHHSQSLGRFNGDLRISLYTKEVPIRVLRLIADIPEELRQKFGFYVTDYRALTPDPFLMAIPKGSREHEHVTVLAVWDEPSFGVE